MNESLGLLARARAVVEGRPLVYATVTDVRLRTDGVWLALLPFPGDGKPWAIAMRSGLAERQVVPIVEPRSAELEWAGLRRLNELLATEYARAETLATYPQVIVPDVVTIEGFRLLEERFRRHDDPERRALALRLRFLIASLDLPGGDALVNLLTQLRAHVVTPLTSLEEARLGAVLAFFEPDEDERERLRVARTDGGAMLADGLADLIDERIELRKSERRAGVYRRAEPGSRLETVETAIAVRLRMTGAELLDLIDCGLAALAGLPLTYVESVAAPALSGSFRYVQRASRDPVGPPRLARRTDPELLSRDLIQREDLAEQRASALLEADDFAFAAAVAEGRCAVASLLAPLTDRTLHVSIAQPVLRLRAGDRLRWRRHNAELTLRETGTANEFRLQVVSGVRELGKLTAGAQLELKPSHLSRLAQVKGKAAVDALRNPPWALRRREAPGGSRFVRDAAAEWFTGGDRS